MADVVQQQLQGLSVEASGGHKHAYHETRVRNLA